MTSSHVGWEKAFAYITRGNTLLVFDHTDHPDAGTQVPGGTLEPDEAPEAAVLREAQEETGLGSLEIVRSLGVLEGNWAGRPARMHGFELSCAADVQDAWEHGEFSYAEPIRFAFRWITISEARQALFPEQAHFVSKL